MYWLVNVLGDAYAASAGVISTSLRLTLMAMIAFPAYLCHLYYPLQSVPQRWQSELTILKMLCGLGSAFTMKRYFWHSFVLQIFPVRFIINQSRLLSVCQLRGQQMSNPSFSFWMIRNGGFMLTAKDTLRLFLPLNVSFYHLIVYIAGDGSYDFVYVVGWLFY